MLKVSDFLHGLIETGETKHCGGGCEQEEHPPDVLGLIHAILLPTTNYNFKDLVSNKVFKLIRYNKKMSFKDEVYKVVKKIPKGKVLTYKQVAEKIGRPKSYRAVGNILNKNFDSNIPCHRVIRSDGKLGGYNRGMRAKTKVLKEEGYL